jgi:predicted NBD/HSP70 family sugar kinase
MEATGSRSRIRAELADGRPYTVGEISGATGLARSTVVQSLTELEAGGTVRRHAPRTVGRGRPAHLWSIADQPGPLIVLVAAAHGTTVGVVRADGKVLAARAAPAFDGDERGRRASRVPELLDRVLADAMVGADDITLAVVGLPGASGFSTPASPGTQRDAATHLNQFRVWDGADPSVILRDRLTCPIHYENDANLAALGEVTHGVGRGLRAALYVSLAHGTGAGLVIDGRLHRGRSSLAGEIGHLHAQDDGRLCHCGARGCFWHRTSFPALLDDLARAHGRRFTSRDVAEAAERDESDVVRSLHGLGFALGRRLADAVVFLDPEAIILDGGLGAASKGIATGVRQALQRYAPPLMARSCDVRPGLLGRHAALVGGASLARSEQLLPAP